MSYRLVQQNENFNTRLIDWFLRCAIRVSPLWRVHENPKHTTEKQFFNPRLINWFLRRDVGFLRVWHCRWEPQNTRLKPFSQVTYSNQSNSVANSQLESVVVQSVMWEHELRRAGPEQKFKFTVGKTVTAVLIMLLFKPTHVYLVSHQYWINKASRHSFVFILVNYQNVERTMTNWHAQYRKMTQP